MHRVWSLLLTWHWNRGGVNPPRVCTGPGFLSGWTLTDDACSARRIAHKTGNDLLTAVESRVPAASRAGRLGHPAGSGMRWRHQFKDSSPWSLRTTFTCKLSPQGAAVRMATFLLPQVWLYHACQPLKWMELCAPRCAETLPGQGHWEFPLSGHSHRVPKWALTAWAGGPSRYSLQQLRPSLLKVSLLGVMLLFLSAIFFL